MGSDPGKVPGNQEILGFLVRAPIDHFLRGKCDKCPPRVRRVKSGNPKNGHASGTFLDIFGLAAPLFWPILSIKGRTEPLKIQDFRVFFTFFHFFSLFRPKSDPKQGQNGSDLGNPGKSGISWDFLPDPGISGKSWDFRLWLWLFRLECSTGCFSVRSFRCMCTGRFSALSWHGVPVRSRTRSSGA